MKKLFLLLAVLLLTAAAGWAQTQVATLNHQGNIRVFYGPDAFVNAVNAAVDDDVINLSAGYFNPTTIDKRLNIKGAGMLVDNNEDRSNTVILGQTYCNSGSTGSSIEGIRFKYIDFVASTMPVNFTFSKCYVWFNNGSGAPEAFGWSVFNDCVVHINKIAANSTFLNSCVRCGFSQKGYFQNCFIYWTRDYGGMPKTSSFTNCVCTGEFDIAADVSYDARNNLVLSNVGQSSPFNYTYNAVNYVATSDVFKCNSSDFFTIAGDINNWFVGDFDFSLTDEAASQYVGTDGTQVGIYGGNMPFTPVVSNPRIVKCEVDSETSPEGKLNVNIEVKEGR